jgi:hypothetical protein
MVSSPILSESSENSKNAFSPLAIEVDSLGSPSRLLVNQLATEFGLVDLMVTRRVSEGLFVPHLRIGLRLEVFRLPLA